MDRAEQIRTIIAQILADTAIDGSWKFSHFAMTNGFEQASMREIDEFLRFGAQTYGNYLQTCGGEIK